jgi:hypothetical protein
MDVLTDWFMTWPIWLLCLAALVLLLAWRGWVADDRKNRRIYG